MHNSVQQIGKNIEAKLLNIQKYMYLLFTDEDIQDIVGQYDLSKDYAELYKKWEMLGKIFSYYFEGEKYLLSAVIFDMNAGEYIYRNIIPRDIRELRNSEWFEYVMKSKGQIYWMGAEKLLDRYSREHNILSVARMIKDLKNVKPLDSIGMIYLCFSESLFGDIYIGIQNDDEAIIIIDDLGRVVSHSNKDLIGMDLLKDESYLIAKHRLVPSGVFQNNLRTGKLVVSYFKVPSFNWTVIKTVPYEYISRQLAPIAWITVFACIIVFAGMLILSIFISKRIARPLLELNSAMRKVEEGDFSVKVMPRTEDEIGMIQYRFNIMTEKIDSLFHKALQEEYKKNQEQLRALQYQVNPHFLYNTLNTIRLMAILSNCNNIRLACEALTRLLRNAIGKMGEMVPVTVEINNIKDYIYIQQIKNDGNLHVEYLITPEIMHYRILSFILQPIVENAIFHGLEPRKNIPGKLLIKGEKCKNHLVFIIEDDGIGMTEENIQRVFEDDISEKTLVKIGIKNVDKRIKLNYGEKYGIMISSKLGVGTVVKITLPIITERGDNK